MAADRPILFSAPMIQALLAGKKTQTRRLASSPLRRVRPGDRLWVRESFAEHVGAANLGEDDVVFYRATADEAAGPWKPSIHMPRRLSRLTLLVTDVRVQRLQHIAEADAMAEGVEPALVYAHGPGSIPHVFAFRKLWDQLHGPGGWEANPEVVALTFEVKQRNIDDWELTDG